MKYFAVLSIALAVVGSFLPAEALEFNFDFSRDQIGQVGPIDWDLIEGLQPSHLGLGLQRRSDFDDVIKTLNIHFSFFF